MMATNPITADEVKKLRDQTGAGMMECKAALTEANGDFEEAITILRKRGLAQAAKKAGRATSEGLDRPAAVRRPLGRHARRGQLRVRLRRANRRLPAAHGNDALAEIDKAGDGGERRVAQGSGRTRPASASRPRSPSWARTWPCRASRATQAPGYVGQYIHLGGKIGVQVEFGGVTPAIADRTSSRRSSRRSRCRSRRPARRYVSREAVPADVLDRER